MKKKKKKNSIWQAAFPGWKGKTVKILLVIILAFLFVLSIGSDLMFRLIVFVALAWICSRIKKIQNQLEVCSE